MASLSESFEPPPYFPTYTKKWHTKVYPTISPSRPENSAEGKVVIVTGGGTGIGAAIAKAFVQAGAKAVGILGRREELLKISAATLKSISTTTEIEYAVADITDTKSLEVVFDQFERSFGKIDVLISNAAQLDIVSLKKSEGNGWWSSFEVNVKGTYNVIQTFLPRATSNAVFLGVNAGLPPLPGYSSYVSSKAAAARLLECLQVEHPEFRVVSVHPGVVESEMTDKTKVPPMDDAGLVAGLMVWLAGPEADFLKGKFLWANMDVDELKKRAVEVEKSSDLRLGLLGLTAPGKRK